MQRRRILPVEHGEMNAIEPHQPAAGPDPQVSIPGLGEGLHRLFRQTIRRLPNMPRVSRKSIALRRGAGTPAHHNPGGRRNPGGNQTYSMHGGAQYTAKQPVPAHEQPRAPSFRVFAKGWETGEPAPPSRRTRINSVPYPTFDGSKERPRGIEWSFSKEMLRCRARQRADGTEPIAMSSYVRFISKAPSLGAFRPAGSTVSCSRRAFACRTLLGRPGTRANHRRADPHRCQPALA